MKSNFPLSHDVHIELNWCGTNGIIKGQENLEVGFDRPKVFGGKGEFFCPDELFIGALASCFINTFLSLSSRFDEDVLSLDNISLNASAELILEDIYCFHEITIKGKISFNLAEKFLVKRLIKLSKQYCHLFASLSPEIKTTISIDIEIKDSEFGGPISERIILN